MHEDRQKENGQSGIKGINGNESKDGREAKQQVYEQPNSGLNVFSRILRQAGIDGGLILT